MIGVILGFFLLVAWGVYEAFKPEFIQAFIAVALFFLVLARIDKSS